MRTYPFCFSGLLLFLIPSGVLETKPVKTESLNNSKLLSRKKKVNYYAYFYNFIHTLCTYVNWTYSGIRKYYWQQGLRLQQGHTVFVIKRLWTFLFYFIIIPLLPCINLYPTDFMAELICFMLTAEVG